MRIEQINLSGKLTTPSKRKKPREGVGFQRILEKEIEKIEGADKESSCNP